MNKMMMMRFDWFFALALLVSLYFPLEAATRELQLQEQEIGTEICYCAPNSYEFTLDFFLTCPPVNITLGDAVAATTCMVSPFGDPEVSDLVPVSVQSIDILELNQNLQVIVQENIGGDFIDGDTFSYISYAAIPGMIVNPEDLPRAIQLNIVGLNKDGEEIINVYLITFTNACGAYPVLSEGQFAGWTRFSDLGPPDQEYCPAAPSTTTPPTPRPTLPPTPMMSMSMSMNMDMNFKSLTLEDSFSIGDYLDGTIDVMEGRDSSPEFGYKGGKGGKGEKSGKPDFGGKGGKGGKGEKSGKPDFKGGKGGKGGKSGKPDFGTKQEKSETKKEKTKLQKSEKDATKGGKGGEGGKGGKGEKSGKSDFETKKGKNETKQEKNETKKEKTKLQKSEKDATKSEKKRLRI